MPQVFQKFQEVVRFLLNAAQCSASGEITLQSDGRSGKIYLESGLVLWAFATGQEISFQSILVKEYAFSPLSLREGIERARQEGKRHLSEMLDAVGVFDDSPRRDIVLRHTRSAFACMDAWENIVLQFEQYHASGDTNVDRFPMLTVLPKAYQSPGDSLEEVLREIGAAISPLAAALLVEKGSGFLLAQNGALPPHDAALLAARAAQLWTEVSNGFSRDGSDASSMVFSIDQSPTTFVERISDSLALVVRSDGVPLNHFPTHLRELVQRLGEISGE